MSNSTMTPKAAARIHSVEAKKSGGSVNSKSFTARATKVIAKQGVNKNGKV